MGSGGPKTHSTRFNARLPGLPGWDPHGTGRLLECAPDYVDPFFGWVVALASSPCRQYRGEDTGGTNACGTWSCSTSAGGHRLWRLCRNGTNGKDLTQRQPTAKSRPDPIGILGRLKASPSGAPFTVRGPWEKMGINGNFSGVSGPDLARLGHQTHRASRAQRLLFVSS
jgi:hypothetical protein